MSFVKDEDKYLGFETAEDKIEKAAQEVAKNRNLLLYDLNFQKHSRVLLVMLDKDPDGISIDECAQFSRDLSFACDLDETLGEGAYHLEVSSPGLERPLKKLWHFERAIGKRAKVWFFNSDRKKMCFEADIIGVEEQEVSFQKGQKKDSIEKIQFKDIEKAHLIFDFEKNFGKNKSKKK